MRIGFDAYFAFHYKTGVAHYSRNLINGIAKFYPGVELILFTDETTPLYQPLFPNVHVIAVGKEIPYHEWLSNKELHRLVQQNDIDIFHGLDHGLPGLQNKKTVVTIHDLFFETNPELYRDKDVVYYRSVAPKACAKADAIISISKFTTKDIVRLYKLPLEKIHVCYQSCNPLFFQQVSEERKNELRKQFDLPGVFWLYVGSVTMRKNLYNICKAVNAIKEQTENPLIVIGEGGDYLSDVQSYIAENHLEDRVRFLSYTDAARNSLSFQQAKDIPAFYQMAFGLLYPSFHEGFGIPLIEAFASAIPVITAQTTSLPEIGQDGALYVDPYNAKEIGDAMLKLENDEELRSSMILRGNKIVQNFTEEKAAASVMNVYRQLL